MNEKIKIQGTLNIQQYIDDKLVNEYIFNNLVTDSGKDYFRRIIGGEYGSISKIGLGDSAIAANVIDTALKNRVILLDVLGKDYSIGPNAINFLATVPQGAFGSTVNFKEGGLIYKDATNEILITRTVFPQIIYQTTDSSLSLSYSLKFL